MFKRMACGKQGKNAPFFQCFTSFMESKVGLTRNGKVKHQHGQVASKLSTKGLGSAIIKVCGSGDSLILRLRPEKSLQKTKQRTSRNSDGVMDYLN